MWELPGQVWSVLVQAARARRRHSPLTSASPSPPRSCRTSLARHCRSATAPACRVGRWTGRRRSSLTRSRPTYQWRFRYNAGSSSALQVGIRGGPQCGHVASHAQSSWPIWLGGKCWCAVRFAAPRSGDYVVQVGGRMTAATGIDNASAEAIRGWQPRWGRRFVLEMGWISRARRAVTYRWNRRGGFDWYRFLWWGGATSLQEHRVAVTPTRVS